MLTFGNSEYNLKDQDIQRPGLWPCSLDDRPNTLHIVERVNKYPPHGRRGNVDMVSQAALKHSHKSFACSAGHAVCTDNNPHPAFPQQIYNDISHHRASGQSALLKGATGTTGKQLLCELLASPQFIPISEAGQVVDFEKIEQAALTDGGWELCSGRALILYAGCRYVVSAAKPHVQTTRNCTSSTSLCVHSPISPLGHSTYPHFRAHADIADAHAYALYRRSKGPTEQALTSLSYSDTLIYHLGGYL
ncbi:hypothetical protein EW146_g2851 [Bondarzewia mesenterica]|uniref:Uncharacterized protein n=1 Tax=Bondarzewia mesenterica TaxID=1095465 RepID=A0A4S4LZF8_9AGAM|nr:hypothetical protein EW146_g2851 [Bondarzewia mesenterica]